MTHISELVGQARDGARQWSHCPPEQALVYSCETIAAREHPGRRLEVHEAVTLVADICLAEDIDVPGVRFGAGSGARCVAWADRTAHELGFAGSSTDTHTVVHELAHLLSHSDLHDATFRDLLVRLGRSHVGVQHAALLHSLFVGVGLGVSPWTVGATSAGPVVVPRR